MISLTFFKRHFTPTWRMSFLALLGLLFFSRLGFWQLDRAAQKKTMLGAEANWLNQAAIAWKPGRTKPQPYQRISIEGRYLAQVFLLDNQHYHHRVGYQVLSPLVLKNGKLVLIDRGWVAGDRTRRTLPKVDSPKEWLKLSGSAYYPQGKNWLLGQALEKKGANVTIIEQMDTALIEHFLHKSVYPFIIRLAEKEKHGYIRDWPIVAMLPERHYAYALQWFALALLVLILFFSLNLKKNDEKKR